MGASSNGSEKFREDVFRNQNVQRAVYHNKDGTTFFSRDQNGNFNVCCIDHPDYNIAYDNIVVPMFNKYNKRKYLTDE
jgi:hypothetical protein